MAYATAAELAGVLNIEESSKNKPLLEACLNAAATEIDHFLDNEEFVELDPGLLNRTNINRAVEWWKQPDAYALNIGTVEQGTLAPPDAAFERHAAMLLPYKTTWGLA
jgi:hypothetical protein